MVQEIQQVRETSVRSGNATQKTTEINSGVGVTEHRQNIAERLVWYVAGIILFLLGFRFILSLLGANQSNSFANFIYTTSHPFVAPFFSLFSYRTTYGTSRFELYTLVAIAFYMVVAYGITLLINIDKD